MCTVTEDATGDHRPARTLVGLGAAGDRRPPVTVEAGGTASVTVTNTVAAALGRAAGDEVRRRSRRRCRCRAPSSAACGSCTLGDDDLRRTASPSATTAPPRCSPRPTTGCRRPPSARSPRTPSTLDGLRDGSFAWGEPTYAPDDVALVAGETATLGVTNTVDPCVLRRDDPQGRHRSGRRPACRHEPPVHRDDQLPVRDGRPDRDARGRRPIAVAGGAARACSSSRCAPSSRTSPASGGQPVDR